MRIIFSTLWSACFSSLQVGMILFSPDAVIWKCREMSTVCTICLVHEAQTEEALRLHKASAHYKAFVCLLCKIESYPKTINGIKGHYLSQHKDEYMKNKVDWDKKFTVMKRNLEDQAAKDQASKDQAAKDQACEF